MDQCNGGGSDKQKVNIECMCESWIVFDDCNGVSLVLYMA